MPNTITPPVGTPPQNAPTYGGTAATAIIPAPNQAPANTITAPNLTSPTYTTPPPAPSLLPNAAQGLVSSVQGQLDTANNDTQRYQSLVDQRLSEANSLNTDIGNQGQYQQQQEQSLGVPAYQQQLRDINTSIAQKMGAFQQATAQIQNDSVFSGFAEGEKGRLNNVAAAQIGALSSVAQALQGNITAAQTQAQHTTDLLYKPKIAQLQNAIQFITQNRDNLTASQKKQADAQQKSYETQLNQVQVAQADHTNALTQLGIAAQAGAPHDLIARLAQNPNLGTKDVYSSVPSQYIGKDKYAAIPYTGQIYNTVTGEIRGGNSSGSSGVPGATSGGVVGGYDISNYATNPQNASQVANILSHVQQIAGGSITSVQVANNVIQTLSPNSSITGDMIMSAAQKTGVDPSMLIAMMTNESNGGTSNVARVDNNLAGITWTGSKSQIDAGMTQGSPRPSAEGGFYAHFPTAQAGIDSLAQNLAGRKVETPSFAQYGTLASTDFNPNNSADQMAKKYLDNILNGKQPTASDLGLSTRVAQGAAGLTNASARASDLYFKATGQPLPNPTDIKQAKLILNSNNKVLNSNEIQTETVQKNFNLAINGMVAGKVNNTTSTYVNGLLNAIYAQFGDPATIQAGISNGTLGKELGNLLSVKNAGGGTTVADTQIGESLMNKDLSVEGQKAALQRLTAEALNIHSALRDQNAKLYSITDPFMTNPQNPLHTLAQKLLPGEVLVKDGNGNIGAMTTNDPDFSKYTRI